MASGEKSLSGKVALVTGSTSGIGLGIARCLGAQGADLMLNGFGEAGSIEALRTELAEGLGVRVEYDGADMMQPAQIAGLVHRTQATLGGLDVLVNNAGIQHTAEIKEFPVERWDAVNAINLSAAFHAMRQHRLSARIGGQRAEVRLRRGEAWPDRADEGRGHRVGEQRGDGERGVPRLGADAFGAGAA